METVLKDTFNFVSNNWRYIVSVTVLFVVSAELLELVLRQLVIGFGGADNVTVVLLGFNLFWGAIFQCSFIVMLDYRSRDLYPGILGCVSRALPSLINYIVASISINVLILLGLLLLVVPGAYLYARFLVYDFMVVLQGKNPATAFQDTWELTQGWVLKIVMALVPLLTAGVGIFFLSAAVVGYLGQSMFVSIASNFIFLFIGGCIIVARYRIFILLSKSSMSGRAQT